MSKNIRAKFKCTTVVKTEGPAEKVDFAPVMGKDNEPWSKWTPAGLLSLTITNPAAQGAFEPGKTYFIDIAPVVEDV